MAPLKRSLALLCILTLLMLACSVTVDLGPWPFGASTAQLPLQDRVATSVAQTVQALTQVAQSATATSAPLPTATATNAPVPATLSVSVATNCYAGPRTNYGFVITIYPGTTVTVEGKDTGDNYWIIDVPGYPGTLCWLSGQNARVTGDIGNLPSPATPVPSLYSLSEPKNLRVSCSGESDSGSGWSSWHGDSDLTVVFRWTNTEPHQAGVRVYRNGYRIATLGAHASSYTDSTSFHGRHRDLTYGVQAYSGTAVSSIVSINVGRCR